MNRDGFWLGGDDDRLKLMTPPPPCVLAAGVGSGCNFTLLCDSK